MSDNIASTGIVSTHTPHKSVIDIVSCIVPTTTSTTTTTTTKISLRQLKWGQSQTQLFATFTTIVSTVSKDFRYYYYYRIPPSTKCG